MRDRYDRGDFRGQRGHDRRHDNGRYDRYDRRDDNNSGRYDRGNNRRDNNRRDNNSGYRGTTPRRGTGNGTTNLSSSRTTVSQEIGRSSRGNSFNNSPTRIYRPAGGSTRPANTFTPSRSSSSNNRSAGGNSSSRGGGRSGGGGRFGR